MGRVGVIMIQAAVAALLGACAAISGLDEFELTGASSAGGAASGGAIGAGAGPGSGGAGGSPDPVGSTGSGGAAAGGGGSGGSTASGGGSPPPPVCGDGAVDWRAGEQCDDGNAQDGDGCGATCSYQASSECPIAVLVVGTNALNFTGDTTGDSPTAQASCGGATADEVIYRVQAATSGTLHAVVNAPSFSKMTWARSDCPGGAELACVDASPNPQELTVVMAAGDIIFLGVDGNGGQEGPFALQLVIAP